MKRITINARNGWQKIVADQGLIWHTLENGKPYWNEGAYYVLTTRQVDELEKATIELQEMFLVAGQFVLDNNLFSEFGIPEFVVPLIKRAWEEEPPALYHGRFDLAYDGTRPPKLLEYNADTPTSLLEAAVIQWNWKEDLFPQADQFNSIHERLIAKWKVLRRYLRGNTIHFAHINDACGEDSVTVGYLRDTAEEAGFKTSSIPMEQIGWHRTLKRFVDETDTKIDTLFHLYPWEWLVNEEFGKNIPTCYDNMHWIEPIWKMLWSNKAVLAVLWKLYPDSSYLLEAHLDNPGTMTDYVKKPLLSREGANITIVRNGDIDTATLGDYGEEGYVYQQYVDLPIFDGVRPIIGSWIIDGESAGIGIREGGIVTGNLSQFVPHIFEK